MRIARGLHRVVRRRAAVLAALAMTGLLQLVAPMCVAASAAAAAPPCHDESGGCVHLHARACADPVPLTHDLAPVPAPLPPAGACVAVPDDAGEVAAVAARAPPPRGADPPIPLRYVRLRN